MRKHKIKICKLGLGFSTPEGAYWAKVDGDNIGEDGRAFWETHEEAQAAAERYIDRFSS